MEENIISKIAWELHTLKEDKPYLVLTNDIIKGFIESNMEELIEAVENELNEY